jgi:hypothetical protein
VAADPSGAGPDGGRDKGEAEQVLLDKAVKDSRHVFTPDRLWVMDRNYPGVPRIKALLATGTHALIRVKDGITLNRVGEFLPEGRIWPRSQAAVPRSPSGSSSTRSASPDATLPICSA